MKRNVKSRKIASLIICFTLFLSLSMGLDFETKAVEASGLINKKVYCIKNVESGKYLNVYGGYDVNGQNIVQWTKDGSVEQKFKLEYNDSLGCYMIYAMCSSSGTNRVVDVSRNNGSITSGCNVAIWTPDDTEAQFWRIVYVGAGKYRIVLNSNTALVLTSVDDSNGTSGGKSSTSPGNVFISTYSATNYQHWIFEEVSTSRSIDDGQYYIRNNNSGKYLDVANSGSSGANVTQWDFHSGMNQKWSINYLNNGYYVIKPAHNNNLALDVYNNYDYNDSNIDVQTAPSNYSSIPDNMQWKIIPCSDGIYRIASKCSYNDKVLTVQGASMDNGANVIQYKYNETQNDEWVFEQTKHGTFTMVGIEFSGHDHTSYMAEISDAARIIGGGAFQTVNTDLTQMSYSIRNSGILVIRSHGSQNDVSLANGEVFSRFNMSGWSKYELKNARLILYGACETGLGGESANNLVNSTFNRGAKTVIGFQSAVGCDQMNTWTKEFFVASGNQSKTITQSLEHADYWTGFYHWGNRYGTDNRLVRGSTEQKLIN